VRLDLGFVHDHLHEGDFPEENILFVVDVFHGGEEDVEFVQLVASRHASLNRHVQVVQGPSAQVLHPALLVGVVVDQGLKIGPLIKKILPVSQLFLSRDHQELSADLVLRLQVMHEVDKSDAFAETFLISKDFVLVGEEGRLQTVQTPLLEL